MKKRIVMVLLALALVTGGAFAQIQMSAGVGGLFDLSFQNSKATGGYTNDITWIGLGGYAFFDITYANVQVGYINKTGSYKTEMGSYSNSGTSPYTYNFVNLAVYGKYPFALAEKISLFPQIGFDYQMLSTVTWDGKEYNVTNKSDWANMWLKAGVGLDIGLTEQLYLRIEALYGIKFNNKANDDEIEDNKKYISGYERALENGLTAKLAVGWKF